MTERDAIEKLKNMRLFMQLEDERTSASLQKMITKPTKWRYRHLKSRCRRNLYLTITLVILFLYSIVNVETQSKSVTI